MSVQKILLFASFEYFFFSCNPSYWETRIWGCQESAWSADCCWTLTMGPHGASCGPSRVSNDLDAQKVILWVFWAVTKGQNVWSGDAIKQWLLGWVRISDGPNCRSGQHSKYGGRKLHSTPTKNHSFVLELYSIGLKIKPLGHFFDIFTYFTSVELIESDLGITVPQAIFHSAP